MFDLAILKKMFDAALAYLSKEIRSSSNSIVDAIEKLDKDKDDTEARAVLSAVQQLKIAVEKLKNPTFSGEVTFDASEIETAFQSVASEISALADKIKMPELDNVQAALKVVKIAIEEQGKAQKAAFTDGIKSLEASIKALANKPVSALKLDEAQFRTLAVRGGGGGGPSVSMATPTIANVALTLTNTQYSYTFPANTISWNIKLRGQGSLLYFSWASGKLPTSGDGSSYMTIPQNYVHSQPNVEYSKKTIYLGSDTASEVAEIEVYTR